MKYIWIVSALSLLLAVSSFCLAWKGIDGWGWFLFGAIITYSTPGKSNNSKND